MVTVSDEKETNGFDELAEQLMAQQSRQEETNTAKEMSDVYVLLRDELLEQGLDEDAAQKAAFLSVISNLMANWLGFYQERYVGMLQAEKHIDMQLTKEIVGAIMGTSTVMLEKLDELGDRLSE